MFAVIHLRSLPPPTLRDLREFRRPFDRGQRMSPRINTYKDNNILDTQGCPRDSVDRRDRVFIFIRCSRRRRSEGIF
jgi:hypothetical protein